MFKKFCAVIIVLFVLVLIASILGVGNCFSGSAALDLKAELAEIYGEEYTGKVTENGTQDMRFEVTSKTFFITKHNFRTFFNLDYIYECKVIYTDYADGMDPKIRTITYRGVDETGNAVRAYLLLDTKKES